MAINVYTRKKGTQITANFNSKEFDCKGSTCKCSVTRVDSKLARKLQVLRKRVGGKSITINSGNRCTKHNRLIGGGSASYHLSTKGKAADIVVSGMAPKAVAKIAQELGFTGIGCYTGTQGYFVHVDVRPNKYYWNNTRGKDVSTSGHGGIKKNCPYTLGNVTLKRGSTGNSVRALQWILDWCGYGCGVDGDFGKKTEVALKAFQKDMNIGVDGIAGVTTLTALREVSA